MSSGVTIKLKVIYFLAPWISIIIFKKVFNYKFQGKNVKIFLEVIPFYVWLKKYIYDK